MIELTLLLKAAGFRLESFDFGLQQNQRNGSEGLKVEMQCHKSGIVSKLCYKLDRCSCPNEDALPTTSFWEVQASSPNTTNTQVRVSYCPKLRLENVRFWLLQEIIDASSNLLPSLTPEDINTSNALINLILERFKKTKTVECCDHNDNKSP